jgi:Cu(I)/Ag(I) efflux system membrane protein CusA/SilA
MIEAVIRWSVHNRVIVLLIALLLTVGGIFSLRFTPLDAIPDLSDIQVIVKTSYPGQSPQVVEDQVTYPLTTALMSVPGATTVRGFSFFGDSYVYVIFDDDTDLYWARSRVLEYLNQVSSELPAGVQPALGPDATGVGWVYLYALTDTKGNHDLADLRALQDWFLKYELQTVEGVAEVASLGGMVKQYQVQLSADKLRAYQIPITHVKQAITRGNQAVGASVIELAEAEYMVTATGYLKGVEDIRQLPLGVYSQGSPLTIGDIATVVEAPQMRRGIAELNGKGEVVGGIIVMRYGENAKTTIDKVKQKLASLKASLPEGVRVVPVYDRSELIVSAVNTLWQKIVEELLVVALVCFAFLLHVRSALVAIISLPIGVLFAFIAMRMQGLNANIMSLGGIAIAIGAMVDGAIVVVENLHKHLEKENGTALTAQHRWALVVRSSCEVGPALFFSLLIITVSFIPVFTLQAQEGRLFAPLAFTKTYAMGAAALIAITLVPILAGYLVRGKIRAETQNPVSNVLVRVYRFALRGVLNYPRSALLAAFLAILSAWWPLAHTGSEFMPTIDEGDLMYMPTTYPSLSIGKARQLLQQTDKLIVSVPEVARVFGKIGRAETATDPAPLTMIETFIQLKPKSQWRAGMTTEKLKAELNQRIQFPGITNAWVMPIKTRIDMLATGIKTPVGIKVAGPHLEGIEQLSTTIEALLMQLPDTASAYAEKVAAGRYLTIDIDRQKAARYNLNITDIQEVIAIGVGGKAIAESNEGRERYAISVRFDEVYRNSPEALRTLPLITPSGRQIPLSSVADIRIEAGPAGIKSENARLTGWVLVDINDSDLAGYVANAKRHLKTHLNIPPGYSLSWAGQFEYLERAQQRMKVVVPLTLVIIILLLALSFRRARDVVIILTTLPLSLVGGVWLLWLMNFQFSVAVAVGFIALAGVAVETGVIMLVYLNQTNTAYLQKAHTITKRGLKASVVDGAVRRVRPVMMTSVSIIACLLPVLLASGTGAEIMSRIAAPMIGGMVSVLILTLFILPSIYYLLAYRRLVANTLTKNQVS